MEVGHQLQFMCQKCEHPVSFSILDPESLKEELVCSHCRQSYRFDDKTLIRQLKLFEALCRQIHQSQEILSTTSIAMDVGNRCIKVPFNLLLTRFSSVLELQINGRKTEILFRIEPVRDIALL